MHKILGSHYQLYNVSFALQRYDISSEIHQKTINQSWICNKYIIYEWFHILLLIIHQLYSKESFLCQKKKYVLLQIGLSNSQNKSHVTTLILSPGNWMINSNYFPPWWKASNVYVISINLLKWTRQVGQFLTLRNLEIYHWSNICLYQIMRKQ